MKPNLPWARPCTVVALAAIIALNLYQPLRHIGAQKSEKPKTSHSRPNSKNEKLRTPGVPPINLEYTARIKEYTTQSYFSTELVDYLPASDKVPSPDKIRGYAVGAPGHLTYTKDLYRY